MNKNNNNNEIFIRIFVSILILLTTHAAIAYILKSIAYTKEIVETVEAKWKKRKRKNDTTQIKQIPSFSMIQENYSKTLR